MSAPRAFVQKLASQLLGEYSPYFVYRWVEGQTGDEIAREAGFQVCPIDAAQIADADVSIQKQAGYLGSESRAFGCFVDGHLAGVCFYWFGERYKRRGFWPLKPGEAKLVQIIVSPDSRGRGVAPILIQASARTMADSGFSNLYARIWHSNKPSLRAFDKAGWLRIAFVLEFNPFRAKKPLRIQRNLTAR